MSAKAETLTSFHIGNSLTVDTAYNAFNDFSSVSQPGLVHDYSYHIWASHSLPAIHANPTSYDYIRRSFGNWFEALSTHDWDVVTMQLYPAQGSTFNTDVAAAVDMIDVAQSRPGNQATRFVIYGPWATRTGDYSTRWNASLPDPSINPNPGTRATWAYQQSIYEAVRDARPDAHVELVSIGNLFDVVDQAIKNEVANDGAWNGLTDIDSIYRDDIHLNYNEGRWLASVAMWMAISELTPSTDLTAPTRSGFADDILADPALRASLTQFIIDHRSDYHFTSVPEPASLILTALGMSCFAGMRLR